MVHLNFPLSSSYFLAFYGQPPLPPCPPPTKAHFLWNIPVTFFAFYPNLSIISTLHLLSQGYNIVYPYMYSSPLCSEVTLKSLEMYNNNKTYHKKGNEEGAISAWQLLLQLFWADRENTKKEWKSKPGVDTEREKSRQKGELPDKNLKWFGTSSII